MNRFRRTTILFHETDVRALQPGLTAFPGDVFVPEQRWLAAHLLPLISIDLGILRPHLAGTAAHMLCPIEPWEGYIGNGTEHRHNAYAAHNWFAFELTQDNRYRFLGNEGYFHCAPEHERTFAQNPYAKQHVAAMRESYVKARAYFEATGRLASYSLYGDGEAWETAYLDSLGGEICHGNWTGHPPPPAAFVLTDEAGAYQKGGLTYRHDSSDLVDDGVRITYKGKSFFFVASVAGYNWCATGADSILLFYEPENRIALFTFDWT